MKKNLLTYFWEWLFIVIVFGLFNFIVKNHSTYQSLIVDVVVLSAIFWTIAIWNIHKNRIAK